MIRRATLATATLAVVLAAWPAHALPTMIRLGYPNCVSCHVSPQGGGLLTRYGRGVDDAQSLRAGEYQPTESKLLKRLSWGGRIIQDVRSVSTEKASIGTSGSTLGFNTRLMYRNVTALGKGFRVSAMVTGERPTSRPSRPYDRAMDRGKVLLSSALVHYSPGEGVEFAAGRDMLPTGINDGNFSIFIKSRNRFGFYDTPTQVKMSWTGARHMVIPYALVRTGNEQSLGREAGGGTLAEFDVFGKGKTVVGVNFLRASATDANRRLFGVYTRLGFGSWGVFAEHDITDRTLKQSSPVSFRQHATFAKVFWAAKEWLVLSLGAERLAVEKPFAEDLNAGMIGVSARLTPNFTIGAGARFQRNILTGKSTPSVVFQLKMKTLD